MTDTPRADALLTALISDTPQIEAFAELTDEHEREKALHVLIALLSDPDLRLRVQAIHALRELGDRRAVDPLINHLGDIEYGSNLEQDVLFAQFVALTTLGDPQAILPMLKYRRPRIKMFAHRNVRKFDQEVRLRVLSDAVNHPDDIVRENVMRALGSIRDLRSVNFLIAALDDPCAGVRGRSAFALTLMKATEAVPFLIAHATDPDADMRQYVTLALGELGDPQAIPALLLLLNDEDKRVGFKAAVALSKLGDPSGLDLIYEHISSRETYYASDSLRHASEAFKALGLPALPLVVKLANTILPWNEAGHSSLQLIAEILLEQPDPSALPVLERMLASDETLQAMVHRAIEAIKGQIGG